VSELWLNPNESASTLREGVKGGLRYVEVAGVAEAGSVVGSDIKQPANEDDRSHS